MTKHQQRVKEVYHFFENNDIVLGYRKLLDCVMDTQDMVVYNKAIALTDWKENNPNNIEQLKQQVFALLSELNEITVAEHPREEAVLKATDISKTYGYQKFALGPVSVTIAKGQVYGLVGENGNGKTTLLRILAKELSYNSGHLNYHFKKAPKDIYDLRTKLVYIPQRTNRWYGSLKDNLKFVLANYQLPSHEIETRVLMMIARLGLWRYKHLQWGELSSGYKMRFELARTLLRQPEILLLDEPLANLDVLAQQIILEDLKSIANSVNNPIALILSSQQLYEVEKISDKVIFLKNGKYKDNHQVQEEENNELIVEIDTTATRDELLEVFSPYKLSKLQYNGGLFVAYFNSSIRFAHVMQALGNADVPVTYVRNISSSTRRFFVQ